MLRHEGHPCLPQGTGAKSLAQFTILATGDWDQASSFQPGKAPVPPASPDLLQGVKPQALAPSSVLPTLENILEPHC